MCKFQTVHGPGLAAHVQNSFGKVEIDGVHAVWLTVNGNKEAEIVMTEEIRRSAQYFDRESGSRS